MTTVHAELIGDKVVLPRFELERLIELAQRSEAVELEMREEEIPTQGIMKLAEMGGAFDWLADEEDIYSVEDAKERYC